MKKLLHCAVLLAFSLPFFAQAQSVNYVTSLNDNGAGTLREVITNSFPGDTVRFSVTGTITLTSGYINWNKDLAIDGPGMTQLTISANDNHQIFDVDGGNLYLANLTLKDGSASSGNRAGALDMEGGGVLTCENVTVESCYGGDSGYEATGGAMRLLATGYFTNCYFTNNEVEDQDGTARGGAIYTTVGVYLTNCTFTGNTAVAGGDYNTDAKAYGGAVYVQGSSAFLVVDGCTFTSNAATGVNTYGAGGIYKKGYAYGGAIYTLGTSVFECTNTTFSSNNAFGTGYDSGRSYSFGGAIYGSGSTVAVLEDCDFSSNNTNLNGFSSNNSNGGTMWFESGSSAVMSMKNVTIDASNNKGWAARVLCSNGGNISNLSIENVYKHALLLSGAEFVLRNSHFANNNGVGIWITGDCANAKVLNCTSTLNTFDYGAGITINSATNVVDVTHCTFIDNTATTSSEAIEVYVSNSSTAHLTNNIVSIAAFDPDPLIKVQAGSSITSGGGNIVRDNSGATYLTQPTDMNSANPQMGTYANHGGLYNTFSINSNSPAIDIQGADTLSFDGRGFNRDGSPDAGAYEFGGTDPDLPFVTSFTPDSTICEGDSIELQVFATSALGPNFTYQWYRNGVLLTGKTDSILLLDTLTPGGTPAYFACEVTNGSGTDIDSALVTVSTAPTPNAGNDTAICIGQSAMLNGSGGVTYEWMPATNLNDSSLSNATASPTITTTYTLMVWDSAGCSSTDSMVLTINALPNADAGLDTGFCAGTTGPQLGASGGIAYQWTPSAGLSSDTSASPVASPADTTTYTVVVTDANGCSSSDQVEVAVWPLPTVLAGNDTTICAGSSIALSGSGAQSYVWDNSVTDGATFTPSGTVTYNVTGTDAYGCIDTDDVQVTVASNPTVNASVSTTICAGDSITLSATGASTYSWSGGAGNDSTVTVAPTSTASYTVTGTDANNCTGTDFVIITVNPSYSVPASLNICAGDSVFLAGAWQSTGGTYYDTLQTSNMCDSVIVTSLTVYPNFVSNASDTICAGDSILLAGSMQTVAGVYIDTLSSQHNCDSIILTTLTVLSTPTSNQNVTICFGDSVLLGGSFQTAAGVYYDTLQAANTCDSIVVTTLSVNPSYSSSTTASICAGDSIFLAGAWRTTAGTYNDTMQTALSCDSVLSTTLTINPVYTVPASLSICDGDSAFLAGAWQTVAGTYVDSYTSSTLCDSSVVTTLTINSIYNQNAQATICAGDSMLLGGSYQTTSGTYVDSLSASTGCDSVITTVLTVLQPIATQNNVSICELDSVFAGGAWQTLPGTYTDTYNSAQGCDSIVTTSITVMPIANSSATANICAGDSILLGGAFQHTAGIYIDVFSAGNGCDSIVATTLTVTQGTTQQVFVEICEGDSYFVGGAFQTQQGVYTDVYTGTNGCDSTVNTVLSLIGPVTTSLADTICQGDSIFLAGAFQTAPGIYNTTLQASNGCDSILATNLEVVNCENGLWSPAAVVASWTLVPNPAQTNVAIRFQQPAAAIVSIYDAYGRIVAGPIGVNHATHEVDLSELAGGVYFVRIKMGASFSVQRLIVGK